MPYSTTGTPRGRVKTPRKDRGTREKTDASGGGAKPVTRRDRADSPDSKPHTVLENHTPNLQRTTFPLSLTRRVFYTTHMRTSFIVFVLSVSAALAEPLALFNGKDLTGWRVAPLDRGGAVNVLSNGIVECGIGDPMSGIAYTNTPPTMNYELSLEAMRAEGSDFFIALTIPVETNFCTVIIGGWGGGLCGLSSVDYLDASENQWSEGKNLLNNRWYRLRVRVTPGVLQISLNDSLYNARVEYGESRRLSLRFGDIDKTKPLGLATYCTRALWRDFTLTRITELEPDDKPRNE